MKALSLIFLIILSANCFAREQTDKKKKVTSEKNSVQIGKDSRRVSFLGPKATITLADGLKKNLENIVIGDQLTTCQHGQPAITKVLHITVYNNPSQPLMAVYLRPHSSEETMVPALLLEGAAHHKVQTTNGRKKLKNLSKRDILYHFDYETGLVTKWRVGAIKRNANNINKAYQLTTESGTFLADNLLVTNH
ncbi:hypothetical protein [Dyadobacter tibetensis]|uniref:hypothetical protein n=1 Tax=Dyadobacter tibetensis TaxID=1211851 RepID=UPI0004B9AB28|nr:hypothetical protein [Dyadobacter tibetensis]